MPEIRHRVGIAAPPKRVFAALTTIDAVSGDAGAFVAPGLDCPPTDKGVACVLVPPAPHVTLRLVDANAIETLPDEQDRELIGAIAMLLPHIVQTLATNGAVADELVDDWVEIARSLSAAASSMS